MECISLDIHKEAVIYGTSRSTKFFSAVFFFCLLVNSFHLQCEQNSVDSFKIPFSVWNVRQLIMLQCCIAVAFIFVRWLVFFLKKILSFLHLWWKEDGKTIQTFVFKCNAEQLKRKSSCSYNVGLYRYNVNFTCIILKIHISKHLFSLS